MRKVKTNAEEEITFNDVEQSIVDAVMIKRQVRHFDVKLTLKGKQYIVPVILDSSNQSDNFDFSALPDISDEDCGYLLEKIEQVIDQMPPLEDCKHIKDNPDLEKKFYHGTTGNRDADEFFNDALDEYHAYLQSQSSDEDERLKSYSINHLPNADDDELVTHDYEDWQKMRSIIRSLPTARQIFYRAFYYSPRCTDREWNNACDMLSFELVDALKK
jgi:hypothetical protein